MRRSKTVIDPDGLAERILGAAGIALFVSAVTEPDGDFRYLASAHPSAAGAELLHIPPERFAIAGDRDRRILLRLCSFALLD
jgi:hypothetical protein